MDFLYIKKGENYQRDRQGRGSLAALSVSTWDDFKQVAREINLTGDAFTRKQTR